MVYKHAISTVVPARNVRFNSAPNFGGAAPGPDDVPEPGNV
jgi:hypothetical protein